MSPKKSLKEKVWKIFQKKSEKLSVKQMSKKEVWKKSKQCLKKVKK